MIFTVVDFISTVGRPRWSSTSTDPSVRSCPSTRSNWPSCLETDNTRRALRAPIACREIDSPDTHVKRLTITCNSSGLKPDGCSDVRLPDRRHTQALPKLELAASDDLVDTSSVVVTFVFRFPGINRHLGLDTCSEWNSFA